MAPINPRQYHSLTPSTPRLPKGPSTRPVPVTTSIDSKIFGELFAGTVTIFLLAVVFWKTGKFIRSFNRHKVLREGNPTTARYAKTWYGWVSLETHERNKRAFRNCFTWMRKWMAWRSTRADYRWVWWDPGQEATVERRRERRPLRWLPGYLKSYEFTPADAIWNPGSPAECHGALSDNLEPKVVWPTGSLRRRFETNANLISRECFKIHEEETGAPESSQKLASLPSRLDVGDFEGRVQYGRCSNPRMLKHLTKESDRIQSLPILRPGWSSVRRITSWSYPNVDHSPKQITSIAEQSSFGTAKYDHCSDEHEPPYVTMRPTDSMAHRFRHARPYRVWSAQMQLRGKKTTLDDLRDSSGPPGTPRTDMLGSLMSEQSVAETVVGRQSKCGSRRWKAPIERPPVAFVQALGEKQLNIPIAGPSDQANAKYNTAPSQFRSRMKTMPDAGQRSNPPWHSVREAKKPGFSRNAAPGIWSSSENRRPRSRVDYSFTDGAVEDKKGTSVGLSDWEVKLIDGLDRKLAWMFDETTPGQKPYHFAMLANHWLNRETWLVIDPVSRVSTDARRQWGDPRFNVPYPEPSFSPRSKYPVAVRKRAHTPRINSWRAAVNRQRKVSGVRDAVRTVELYEDSAEEPPDGKIDPACWILPKPPQGFEMSTQQKNAWYEGGAGWQEKLEDWQRVRRGYRLHQVLHEGRVNRNHVNEIAAQASRCCRRACSRLIARDIGQTRRPSHH